MLTAADLTYDPETHTSVATDGSDVPHVTHILAAVGVSVDFEAIAASRLGMADRLEYRRQLGTAFHVDSHAYDDGDLDWATVHADVVPYVRAWAECREVLGLGPVARERRLYHPLHRYTGIMDGVFEREWDQQPARKSRRYGRRQRILVDLKLGDPKESAARWQTAAYEAAYLVEHPDESIDERWAIRIMPERRVPYVVANYSAEPDAPRHFQQFCAFLCTFNHQIVRRARL